MASAVAGSLVAILWDVAKWIPTYAKTTWDAEKKCSDLGNQIRILEDRIRENREAVHISYIPLEEDQRSLDDRFDKLMERAVVLREKNDARKPRIRGLRRRRFGFFCAEKMAKEEIDKILGDLKHAGEVTETYHPTKAMVADSVQSENHTCRFRS